MNTLAEPSVAYGNNFNSWQTPTAGFNADLFCSPILFEEDFTMTKSKINSIAGAQNLDKPKLSFSWEGGLKELKDNFDGVSLQHHINSLR